MKKIPVLLGCALMLCMLTVIAAPKKAKAADKGSAMNGWVSDAKCGAKNDSEQGAACAKKCLDAGGEMVFVNDQDQSVTPVANPDVLKAHAGHHVTVTGKVEDGKLHVDSVKMMKAAS